VNVEHIVIIKMFEEEVNFLLKGREKKQLAKKIVSVSSGSFLKKNSIKDSFKKEEVTQK
jgi:hypothetical protein